MGSECRTGRAGVRLRRIGQPLIGLLLLLTSCSVAASAAGHPPSPVSGKAEGRWVLTWRDEFNGSDGLKQWRVQVGGWDLQQLQWYDANALSLDGHGHLVITASHNSAGHLCWYGSCRYSSGRIDTYGIFSQTYGRFEARIKLPAGRGLWPAFWLEGANVGQVASPGEIDVIETNGHNSELVQSFAHLYDNRYKAFSLKLPKPLSAGYHVYRIDWTPKGITLFVDGRAYGHLNAYAGWPFNHPFFIIINLAVGGIWPGPPDSNTRFPAHMLVDWVRVYREVAPPKIRS